MTKKFEIQDLELSNRCQLFLKNKQINNITTLVKFSAGDLRGMKGCTPALILELRKKLSFHGFCLYGDIVIKSPASVIVEQEIPKMMNDLFNGLSYASSQVIRLYEDILNVQRKLDQIICSEQYKK